MVHDSGMANREFDVFDLSRTVLKRPQYGALEYSMGHENIMNVLLIFHPGLIIVARFL